MVRWAHATRSLVASIVPVAVVADTGRARWASQVVAHDEHDHHSENENVLVNLEIGGTLHVFALP